MFDAVAPRYDLLNRLLSAGSDVRWRRRAVAVALAGRAGARVADICCGTGDLALELARDPRVAAVAGFDFSAPMVVRACRKAAAAPARGGPPGTVRFAVGDAQRLPVGAGQFDVVTIAFGLRNLIDPAAAIAEFARLLQPGGRLVVLEFFRPEGGGAAALFRGYFRHVLPRIGRWLAGRASVDAYRYLPDSVEAFAPPEQVEGWFRSAGFESVAIERMLFGAVGLVTGTKVVPVPAPAASTRELCPV